MKKMKEMSAEIRNKLQRAKTTLEKFSKGEAVSKKMASLALADLEKAVEILRQLEDKARN